MTDPRPAQLMPRCPKHGTVLMYDGADDPEPWCWPCWNVDRQRMPGPDVEGGCIAMSRFMAWAWCEAEASDWAGLTDIVPPGGLEFEPDFGDRACALASALGRGLLRLEWPR